MASPQWPLKEEAPGMAAGGVDDDKRPWYQLEPMGPAPAVQHTDSGRLSSPWQPGFWKRFPVRGLAAWVLALAGTAAAVIILVYSDGIPVDDWDKRLQPTVWLALTSAMTGAFLACAFADGAAISYWRAAGRTTTLQQLHAVYASSTALVDAAWNLLTFKSKTLGLASVLMTLSVLRGPLMQQASSTANQYAAQIGTLDVHIARELPQTYASIITGRNHAAVLLTQNFSAITQGYNNRDPMQVYDSYCDNCTAQVEGFGFDVNCSESSRSFNLTTGFQAMRGATLFEVNVTDWAGQPEEGETMGSALLRLTALYKETSECEGKLTVQTCDLRPGVARFPVHFEGNEVQLEGTSKDDEFLEHRHYDQAGQGRATYADVIGGFRIIIDSLFSSSAFLMFGGGAGYEMSSDGLGATQYISMNSTTPGCNDRWRNPLPDLIEVARELGFRASLQYAHYNTSDVQRVTYTSGTTTLVYVTDYSKMWIAVGVSLVGILAVLPIFYGWWELGRAVSLNPLEIANAFGTMGQEAHIMSSIDPNQSAGGIVRAANDIGPVRYGAWEVEGGVVRLGFAGAGMVRTPGRGERFIY